MAGSGKLISKDVEDILAVSNTQEGILYQCLLHPTANLYSVQIRLALVGKMNDQAFRLAWDFVLQTNEMLRTVFRWEKLEKPVQIVLKNQSIDLREMDLSAIKDQAQRQERLAQLREQDQQEGFDLARGPLFRVTLIHLADDQYELLVSNHHILYDGWSNGLIFAEFFAAYQSFSEGKAPTQQKKAPFKEYLKHAQAVDDHPELVTYWTNYLKDWSGRTPLPSDREESSATLPGVGEVYECRFPITLTRLLQQKCRQEKITPGVILYGAWGLLLHKYTGQNDLLFGVPVSGRPGNLPGVEEMVGLFINTLPLRIQPVPLQRVNALWREIQKSLQEWDQFTTTPLWKIQSTGPHPDEPLFDSLVVVENYPLDLQSLGGLSDLEVTSYHVQEQNQYPLVLEVRTFAEYELKLTYNPNLFQRETIEEMVADYLGVLKESLTKADGTIADLALDGKKPTLPVQPARKKLPVQVAYQPPGNEVEETLAAMWAKVFNKKKIGINDDFYELGGHSLKAMQIISLIHKELDVKISLARFYEQPTVAGVARLVSLYDAGGYAEIMAQPDQPHYGLSFTQKRLWLINQLEPERSRAYHISGRRTIPGKMEVDLILKILQKLVARHGSLRTSFQSEAGQPVQVLHPVQTITLEVTDLSAISADEREILRTEIFEQESDQAFDLAQPPLFRARLVKLNDGESELIFTMHHIISDGWSMEILQREFDLYYQGLQEASDFDLPALPIQYKDVLLWQEQLISDPQRSEKPRAYWCNLLTGELPSLNLPVDHLLAEGEQGGRQKTAAYRLYLSSEVQQTLLQLAGEKHVSLFAILLTGFNILLADYTGQEDLLIGIPTAGRDHAELEKVIGFFVNTVLLRNQVEPTQSVDRLLDEVAGCLIAGIEYQHYPIELVCQELKIKYPRIRAFVNMLNIGEKTSLPSDAQPQHRDQVREGKFDLTVYLTEYVDGIEIDCHYHAGLFEPETIEFLMTEYQRILTEIAFDSSRTVQEYCQPTLPLEPMNVRVEDATQQRIEELLLEVVARDPEHVAVQGLEESLTYGKLDEYATEVAREMGQLREELGLDSSVVILLFEHGIEMIIGIVAALKAGMTYVPVDPDLPRERLAYIVQDSQAGLMVTNQRNWGLADQVKREWGGRIEKVVNVSEVMQQSPQKKQVSEVVQQSQQKKQDGLISRFPDNLSTHLSSANQTVGRSTAQKAGGRMLDDPAYILYTSGSTGKPKGVVQSQRNILHFVRNYIADLEITPADRLTLFSAFGHDAAVMDIYSGLLSGATLYPVNIKGQLNIRDLIQWLKVNRITIYHSVPTVYRYLVKDWLEPTELTELRYIVLGGEQVVKYDLEIFNQFFTSKTTLVNLYGQSESSYNSSLFITYGQSHPRITLGQAVDDTSIQVVDEAGNRVGPLKVGEIVVCSDHVALGYWNDPVRTESVFGGNPEQGRYYRTGDLGKVLPDGRVEFVGRKDFQVKIRGYRVEPGEIESHLLAFPQIREAVVLAQEGNDLEAVHDLVGYLVTLDEVDVVELRRYLQRHLPTYMIPRDFVIVEKMPLTPTNKIDRQALAGLTPHSSAGQGRPSVGNEVATMGVRRGPKIDEVAEQVTGGGTTPLQVERELLQLWANLLHREPDAIGLTESFFDQGGNSLLLMDLATQINQQLQVEVKITDLFKYSTITEMAKLIQTELSQDELNYQQQNNTPNQLHRVAGERVPVERTVSERASSEPVPAIPLRDQQRSDLRKLNQRQPTQNRKIRKYSF